MATQRYQSSIHRTVAFAGVIAIAPAGAEVLPPDLVWICAYSDAEVRCVDTVLESPVVVDCGNPNPLDVYKGGVGTLVLTDAVGARLQYSYGARSFNDNGGPGNLDVVRLFPVESEAFTFSDAFEPCRTYVRP